MKATRTDKHRFALLGRGVEQARKPGERNTDGAAVLKVYPHRVVVEADLSDPCRNGHAISSRSTSARARAPDWRAILSSPSLRFGRRLLDWSEEIGRASCRERGCQSV